MSLVQFADILPKQVFHTKPDGLKQIIMRSE